MIVDGSGEVSWYHIKRLMLAKWHLETVNISSRPSASPHGILVQDIAIKSTEAQLFRIHPCGRAEKALNADKFPHCRKLFQRAPVNKEISAIINVTNHCTVVSSDL